MLLLSDYLNPLLSDLFKIIIKEDKIVANQMTCQFLPFNKKKDKYIIINVCGYLLSIYVSNALSTEVVYVETDICNP